MGVGGGRVGGARPPEEENGGDDPNERVGFRSRFAIPFRRPIIGTARSALGALVIIRVAAPKALVLIEDSSGGELPLTIPGQLVAATSTSIAVGCAASAATEVTVGDLGLVVAGEPPPAFDGRLSTPTRKIAVRTILGATLLEVMVPTTETHIRIWTNAGVEPTKLTIGAAGAGGAVAR